MRVKIAITIDTEDFQICPFVLPLILDILDKHKIRATFFVLGGLADFNPKVPREILSEDHELGCHGWSHDRPYDRRGFNEVINDIQKGTRVIRKFYEARSFRAPYFRPHRQLAMILEGLKYKFDSSVSSKRFDFFLGRTSNPTNFLSPMKPYRPSRENVFRRGDSEIVEIPLSGFILPTLGVIMRNMGLTLFKKLIDSISFFQNIIVFDIHAWEFFEDPKTSIRHRRRTGAETALMFDSFLNYMKQKGEFITLSDLEYK